MAQHIELQVLFLFDKVKIRLMMMTQSKIENEISVWCTFVSFRISSWRDHNTHRNAWMNKIIIFMFQWFSSPKMIYGNDLKLNGKYNQYQYHWKVLRSISWKWYCRIRIGCWNKQMKTRTNLTDKSLMELICMHGAQCTAWISEQNIIWSIASSV